MGYVGDKGQKNFSIYPGLRRWLDEYPEKMPELGVRPMDVCNGALLGFFRSPRETQLALISDAKSYKVDVERIGEEAATAVGAGYEEPLNDESLGKLAREDERTAREQQKKAPKRKLPAGRKARG